MGTASLQSDIQRSSSRKWSLTLSSFRKAPGENTKAFTAAEDAARVRKAAAWQWYTRGVGEVVLPTKMPILARGAPATGTAAGADPVVGQANLVKSVVGEGSGNEKKPSGPESRFKAEASARRRSAGGTPLSTCSPNPLAAAPSGPLYDEVELAGLKTQMADFVQHMQQKLHQFQPEAPDTLQPPPPPRPAEEPVAIRRSSSTASAKVSGLHRPIFTLYRFFRRVINSASYKRNSAAATHEEPAEPDEDVGDVQYHYHHYIHHHHHHYHYDPNPAEEAESNPRLRRHSESSGIRSRIPSLLWEENEENLQDDKELESPLCAFLARRRRHSDNTFAEVCKLTTEAADGGKVDLTCPREMHKFGVAGPAADMRFPARSLSSGRFKTENKVPREWKDYEVQMGVGETGANVRSRRRHSAEGAAQYGDWSRGETGMQDGLMAAKVEGMGGRVYKLSVPGVNYSCSERKGVSERRHSECFDRRAEEIAVDHEKMLRYGFSGKDGQQGFEDPCLRSPSHSAANMRFVASAQRQRQRRRSQ